MESKLEKLRNLFIEVLEISNNMMENNQKENYINEFDLTLDDILHAKNPQIYLNLDNINRRLGEIENELMDFHISAYKSDLLYKEKEDLLLYKQKLCVDLKENIKI